MKSTSLEIVIARVLALTAWAMVVLPLGVGLLLAIATPGYFLPLVQSAIGWLLVGLAASLEVAGLLATWWATRRFRDRIAPLLLLEFGVTVVCAFPVLWLLLLGPAMMIILQTRA